MCKEIEIMRNKSRAEGRREGLRVGRAEGRAEGELKKAKETALNLHALGVDMNFIAKAVNVNVDLVKQWLSQATI